MRLLQIHGHCTLTLLLKRLESIIQIVLGFYLVQREVAIIKLMALS